MNDAELVRRCRQGDREAQRELYAQTADRVYRLLLRMTGDADDALELAQDTFVKAFTNLDRFGGRASPATWVYQIALNEGRQFLRSRKRRRARLAERGHGPLPPVAEATDTRLDVNEALADLPEEERTLITLRYFEDLSYEAIADVTGKPPGTVASGLNRARRLLAERLSRESLGRP